MGLLWCVRMSGLNRWLTRGLRHMRADCSRHSVNSGQRYWRLRSSLRRIGIIGCRRPVLSFRHRRLDAHLWGRDSAPRELKVRLWGVSHGFERTPGRILWRDGPETPNGPGGDAPLLLRRRAIRRPHHAWAGDTLMRWWLDGLVPLQGGRARR